MDVNKGSQEPAVIHDKLKAERIQEMLRELPGWSLARGGTAISRTYSIAATGRRPLVAFAGYVSELAEDHGVVADLDVRLGRVVVTVSSPAVRGVSLGDFGLARALEMRG